jgi:HD-like signal output (HDOD) protein/ActR/RegA family two-component response regulator
MKTLIVDNELAGRTLMDRIMTNYGACKTAENGEAAIGMFKTACENGDFFDLVTLEIALPDINGLDVLLQIRQMEKDKKVPLYKRAVIMMATASADKDTIVTAVQTGCNEYVVKPFDGDTISRRLLKAGLITPKQAGFQRGEQRPINRDTKAAGPAAAKPVNADENIILRAVKDVIEAFKKGRIELPAFPSLIQKIQDVLKLPDTTLEDVAARIEQDQVVTLRLLSVANSVHYGGQGKIKSVVQALTRIGVKDTQNIVSTIAMKSLYKADSAPVKAVMDKLFHHAIATAHMTRAIVKRLNEKDGDTIFLLGLTHDIGKVLLLHGMTLTLLKKVSPREFNMDDVLNMIQTVHAGFGGALFQRWGLAESLIKAVSIHEAPDISADASKMILILHLANMLTRRIGFSLIEEQPPDLSNVMQLLGLDEKTIDTILTEVQDTVQATISSI